MRGRQNFRKTKLVPRLSIEQFGLAARRLTPPKPMGRIHHHHEVELNYVFAGEVTYLHRGSTRRLGPGRLAVFWGAVPHSLVAVAPGSDMAWITLPLAAVRGWGLDPRFLRRLLEGEWCVAPAGSENRFPVASWVAELATARDASGPGLRHELQGCLWWLASRAVPTPERRRAADETEAGLRPVEAMARVMAERYQEPLDVATIAAAAGLHPNYAMTLFKRRCGLTLRDYLAHLRVTHAQRRLLEGSAKVADIALECGFATLSAFYDTFTRRVGMPPRAFREKFAAHG